MRKHGNFLLCSILISTVLVNNSLAILLDNMVGGGMLGIVLSTVGIVILGEIIPQAICSRYGLVIGAKTIWITKFIMLLTGVISYPLGKLIDLLLGKEVGQEYNRSKLDFLIKEQQKNGLVGPEEAEIMIGALTITTKEVREIITPIEDVYMIPYDAVLDFNLINEISSKGYTRVPIYDNDKSNIKSILNVKDLLTTNPADNMRISTLCKFYQRSVLRVSEETFLKVLFEEFIKGRTHMAFIESKTNKEKLIGIATLEDVIEEVFQREINDESDIYSIIFVHF